MTLSPSTRLSLEEAARAVLDEWDTDESGRKMKPWKQGDPAAVTRPLAEAIEALRAALSVPQKEPGPDSAALLTSAILKVLTPEQRQTLAGWLNPNAALDEFVAFLRSDAASLPRKEGSEPLVNTDQGGSDADRSLDNSPSAVRRELVSDGPAMERSLSQGVTGEPSGEKAPQSEAEHLLMILNAARDAHGCTDHGCMWGHRGGMGTNGGCGCQKNLRYGSTRPLEAGRIANALRAARVLAEKLVANRASGEPSVPTPSEPEVQRLKRVLVEAAIPLEALHADNRMGATWMAPSVKASVAKAVEAIRAALAPGAPREQEGEA